MAYRMKSKYDKYWEIFAKSIGCLLLLFLILVTSWLFKDFSLIRHWAPRRVGVFVGILKRDLELLYDQYCRLDVGHSSWFRSAVSHTCNESNTLMESSCSVDPLAFLRNFHKEQK